jgi:hypothetical protein
MRNHVAWIWMGFRLRQFLCGRILLSNFSTQFLVFAREKFEPNTVGANVGFSSNRSDHEDIKYRGRVLPKVLGTEMTIKYRGRMIPKMLNAEMV